MSRPKNATRAEIARRQAKVLQMRTVERLDFRQIGVALKISATQAHRDFSAALRDQVPAEEVAEARKTELLKLDVLEGELVALLKVNQPLVSFGKLVLDADGEPTADIRPKVAVINTMLAISRRRAVLMGLDAPTRIAVLSPQLLQDELEQQARTLDVDLESIRDVLKKALPELGEADVDH